MVLVMVTADFPPDGPVDCPRDSPMDGVIKCALKQVTVKRLTIAS